MIAPKLRRVLCKELATDAGPLRLSSEQSHKIAHVLRLRAGDRLLAVDGVGTEVEAEIIGVDKAAVTLQPRKRMTREPETAEIVLFQAIPKPKAFEDILEKAVELGATKIVPLYSSRSELTPKDKFNTARFVAIIEGAFLQAERARLPILTPPSHLENMKDYLPLGVKILVLDSYGPTNTPFPLPSKGAPLALVVGPEGGFTHSEMDVLLALPQTQALHIPGKILRCETAVCYGLALLDFYRLGQEPN